MGMSTDAMTAAIDRIENDSAFARLVYEDPATLPAEFDLTVEECAAIRDPLVVAIDEHLGEVQAFVALNFAKVKIEYTEQSARDPQSGLPTGRRMHKPFVIVKLFDSSSP
jgi:hypothetical protein